MNANRKLSELFWELAFATEYLGDDPYKARAYRHISEVLWDFPEDIARIYEEGGIEALKEIEGVGEAIAKKIAEFLETGKIKKHQELVSQLPPGALELGEVKGLGPKLVRKLQEHLGLKGIEDLRKAIESGEIYKVPGFGPKKVEALKKALESLEKGEAC